MFGTIVLTIVTLFFLYTTWRSGTAPAEFTERLGLTVANAGGYNEIRAQYAGFFSAAVVCVASLAGTVPRQAAYIVLAVVFGGLLAGRVASMALDGGIAGYGRTIVALYAIDATGLALAVGRACSHNIELSARTMASLCAIPARKSAESAPQRATKDDSWV